MEIRGRNFLVTGGGSGLGAATARMLAAGGANVVVADLEGGEVGDDF
ncbi:MAG: 3-hydroxyacyl-CoA dehydrogenase, partial [Actinomycetota bacterium]|nr:3-hydroxyacyl-CoA dehydrogenase [Actinomycetota bacterium]